MEKSSWTLHGLNKFNNEMTAFKKNEIIDELNVN